MKKLTIFLVFLIVVIACKKDNQIDTPGFLIPEHEVPVWLKTQVEQKSNKDVTLTAWVRYSWQNAYFFEKLDVTSSYSYSLPVSFNGDTLFTFSQDDSNSELFKRYEEEKCCEVYVWKSTDYSAVLNND